MSVGPARDALEDLPYLLQPHASTSR
jgi:hypothetical protein